jgi:uncharacterized protein
MTETIPVETGRFAENVTYFARALRTAGLKIGPGSVVDAVEALSVGGIGGRDDLYWTLHAIFVKRHEDSPVFEQAFRLFFRRRSLVEKMIAQLSPVARAAPKEPEAAKAGALRVAEAFREGRDPNDDPIREMVEFNAQLTVSASEILKSRDFAQMSADEINQARRAIARLHLPDDTVRTRRFTPAVHGHRIDARRTFRRSLRAGGAIIDLAFKAQAQKHPPVVALVDISGSMSEYSRVFLQFLHALGSERHRVQSFVFGTRLTNVTRLLRARDPDEALAACGKAVPDWEGGTRISTALHTFNRVWSRRVLSGGAIVLLFTDGLEREAGDSLAFEMDRLHRSCRKLVWLNPLLRFDGFEAKAGGIRTMLPHVDVFRPIHNLQSMENLCQALGADHAYGRNTQATNPAQWLKAAG